ncbi:hypothetical protein GCM10009843_09960 [Nocardioides bigeumensis]|uniref:Uncharacterized protein n=1 Tax=Nocardioides bigeumensis TaxID=433657 RepID=A0ABN2XV35_9ACTN
MAGAIEAARRIGVPLMFLEGSLDYYGKRGFESATARGFRPPSVRTPDPPPACATPTSPRSRR